MLASKNIHPFVGVEFDKTVGDFRVITYQAYNAFGLIGSECNGIAILNEKQKDVVLAEHLKQSSGYFGVGHRVIIEAENICDTILSDFEAFRKFINEHPEKRYSI